MRISNAAVAGAAAAGATEESLEFRRIELVFVVVCTLGWGLTAASAARLSTLLAVRPTARGTPPSSTGALLDIASVQLRRLLVVAVGRVAGQVVKAVAKGVAVAA